MEHFHLGASSKDLEFLSRFDKEKVNLIATYQGKPVFPAGYTQAAVPGRSAVHMRPEDCVVGLTINGQSRAYPYWIADKYHTINDSIGGERVLVTC